MITGELFDISRKLSQVGASIILRFRIQMMHEISESTIARVLQALQNTSTKDPPHVLEHNRQAARLAPKDHDKIQERINSKTANPVAESQAQKMLKCIKPSPAENISQSTWPCPLTAPIPKLQHPLMAYASRRPGRSRIPC